MVEEEGTLVAGGKHVVPPGVAVEELEGGKEKQLFETCPVEVEKLLASKDAIQIYDDFVTAIKQNIKTRSFFGNWKDAEIESILDEYRDEFAIAGVKVALCTRKSNGGTFRWFEFIDLDQQADYVPQYDVSNTSGEKIRTVYNTIRFPYGVAVEELKTWGGREKLRDKVPESVNKMLAEKGLFAEYDQLVLACVNQGVGRKLKMWKNEKLLEVLNEFKPKFQAKGVDIFICHTKEYVSHGQGGHFEHFRWIEFVDREQQPNYHAQRDATTRQGADQDCSIM